MKFLVDSLPYYGDWCPFANRFDMPNNCDDSGTDRCPRCWDKYKVCSEDNPNECYLLKEIES